MLVIPVFVPHAGCPHDCCFCNQKIISGQTAVPTPQDILQTIALFRPAAPRYREVQLAFYGGSFTAIEEDLQQMYLETVQPFLRVNGGFIDTLRLSTRPDCIDDRVIKRLLRYHVSVVELGAQSMDDAVLQASGRGHTAQATKDASALLLSAGFSLGIQTMTGLPLATEESDLKTAEAVCAVHPDFVRIYPTIVIKGTLLHRSLLNGDYAAPRLQDSVKLCAKLYKIYENAGIPVVRLGLQSSDNISEDGEIAAGPYHSAFGQLVRSELIYNEIVQALTCVSGSAGCPQFAGCTLEIDIDPRKISDCIGQKRSNILRLQEEYGFRQVKVRAAEASVLSVSAPELPQIQCCEERKTFFLKFS